MATVGIRRDKRGHFVPSGDHCQSWRRPLKRTAYLDIRTISLSQCPNTRGTNLHHPSKAMRIPIKVTDDLQRHLGCDGITLESVFIEQKPSRTTVLVCNVDLAQNLINASSPVVKFSKSEFATLKADFMKLATPEHYRT